jgi:hypothetical protein
LIAGQPRAVNEPHEYSQVHFALMTSIDRPRPGPLPTPLVVKNGSVARLNVSSSIPVPLSRTDKANISAGFQDPLICLQGYKDVLIDDDMRVLALRRATLLGADEF